MNDAWAAVSPGARIALGLIFKATVLMAITFICHAALGRRRVLVRSALWNACLIGLLVLPVAGLAFPRFFVAIPGEAVASPILATRLEIPIPIVPFLPPPSIQRAVEPLEKAAIAPPSPVHAAAPPVARPRPKLDPMELAFGLYLAIAALLVVRLAFALAGVGRFKRRCAALGDERWVGALERWRVRLGVGRRVRLMVSDRVSVPVVVGWRAPAIIVPEGLSQTASPVLIDAVLLHELGHVRRGDYAWNLMRKLVQAVYWPHPLAWLAGRVIGSVREQACDDLCVHVMGGSAAYRESLLEVASALVRRPDPALGLAMTRRSNLGPRLAWIDRTPGAPRCRLGAPGRFALAVVVAAAAVGLGALEFVRVTPTLRVMAQEVKTAQSRPDAVVVTVKAKDTGKPLAGAKVRAWVDWKQLVLAADRDGRVRIGMADRTFSNTLALDVWADGYVQQRHYFSQDDPTVPKIPGQVVIELFPGEETLGGTVVDEQSRPIAGVKVEVWGYLGEQKAKEELCWHVDATTDAQGRWRCRSFRAMKFAYLYLSHRDHLSDGGRRSRDHGRIRPTDPPRPDEQPMQALRDFTDVQVVTDGVDVSGWVRDVEGKPIVGAEVGWFEEVNRRSTFHDDVVTTTTDGTGRFRFPHARPGRLALQIKAKGFAPELVVIEAKKGSQPLEITMGPAWTVSGRVVDTRGNPIPDAYVVVDRWRNCTSLGVFLKSDADGRFRWDEAPPDSATLGAGRFGYSRESKEIPHPLDDLILTLKRSIEISGRVQDAKTHKRIEDAKVEIGTIQRASGEFKWVAKGFIDAIGGNLQGRLETEDVSGFRLRFRATGYQSFESGTFPTETNERHLEYNVELTPIDADVKDAVSGTVRMPDGAPLAGARVVIAYSTRPPGGRLSGVGLKNGALEDDQVPTATKTDAQGRFSLIREPDPAGRAYAVVVVHPDFFAEVDRRDYEANPTITARPWGRVEGVAYRAGKPLPSAWIRYHADRLGNMDGVPELFDKGETQADGQGRFVLEHVVPGDVRVYRVIGDFAEREQKGASHGVLLEVKSGETARAELDSVGRPVVARITRPPGFDPDGDYVINSQVEIKSDRESIPYPRGNLKSRDPDAPRKWAHRWWVSAAGRDYRRKYFHFSETGLQPDGTIRVEDVPPGEYQLTLTYCPERIWGRTPAELLAQTTKTFTVPPIPGGRSAEPFDLGVLQPRVKPMLKIGQPVPVFDIETLDGPGRVKTTDFQGKYLLLDFWASGLMPKTRELPYLRAVYDRLGKNPRFAMLSVNLDNDKDAARKDVADHNTPWAQGFAGPSVAGGVELANLINSFPNIHLIGPDGKLVAEYLTGRAIQKAVERALKER